MRRASPRKVGHRLIDTKRDRMIDRYIATVLSVKTIYLSEGEGREWGATWAGASVGLVGSIQPAAEIVEEVVAEAAAVIRRSASLVA